MKKNVLLLCVGFTMGNVYGQVGIGTVNPSSSSMLEVSSTSDGGNTYKGFMPPRVPNIAARDAINAGYVDFGLTVFVTDNGSGMGCLQIWDGDSWSDIQCITLASPVAWINEFHYDNTGIDTDEFIEIAGPAGLDLSTYSIELYNGANGNIYDRLNLSGIISDQSKGIGTISFSYPSNGIENGSPDGIALIESGTVLYFISYEGSFTAGSGGPLGPGAANGMTSTDISVSESGTTPVGESLQLKGNGNQYSNFTWSSPSAESPGIINSGQTIN